MSVKVPVDAITTTPYKSRDPDLIAQAEKQQFENEAFKSELGWLGKFFGGRAEKPGNISGAVVLICFMFLIGLSIAVAFGKKTTTDFGDLFTALTSVITLTLGYLFGSNAKD